MPATDALIVRTKFTEQLNTPIFAQVVSNFIASANEMRDWGVGDQDLIDYWGVESIKNALSVAETFYIGPDMQRFAQVAAESFPLDEVILKQDLPSEAGFLHIPGRYRLLQINGRLIVVHAIIWLNHKVWLLNDKHDLEDQVNRSLADVAPSEKAYHDIVDAIGNWDLIGWVNFKFGEKMPVQMRWAGSTLPPEAAVKTFVDGDNVVLMSDHTVDITQKEHRQDDVLMFLLATWRLMQQTLTSVDTTTDHHPRTAIRRARRNRVPLGVTVIELRRREGSEREGTGQPIDYRYLRRGHWRRVWVGPRNGGPEERYQRAVYIHPQICGPENAPLIIRQKINALVR